jgi:hypothetical protein
VGGRGSSNIGVINLKIAAPYLYALIINMLKNSSGRNGRHGCVDAECIQRMQKLVSQLIGQAKAGYEFELQKCVHVSVTVLDELDTKMVPE